MKKKPLHILVIVLICSLGIIFTTGCSNPCQSCGRSCGEGCTVGCMNACTGCIECADCMGCTDFCAGCIGR